MSNEYTRTREKRDGVMDELDTFVEVNIKPFLGARLNRIEHLEAERDELKRQLRSQAFDHLRELEAAYGMDGSTVPRVITAEELREGQWVAFKPRLGDDWDSGYVEEGPFIVGTVGWTVNFAPDDALAIVLLEDAPAEDSPKRLTGEDMDAAPVGSYIQNDRSIKVYRKDMNGRWGRVGSLGYVYNPADIPEELPTATITPPEKPELPTEPGSVILVTELEGEKLDPPVYAVRSEHMWRSIPRGAFPDDHEFASSFEITGFRPARIVVEDGE